MSNAVAVIAFPNLALKVICIGLSACAVRTMNTLTLPAHHRTGNHGSASHRSMAIGTGLSLHSRYSRRPCFIPTVDL
jgi:hypothetical protein